MNDVMEIDFYDLVMLSGDKLVTDSRKVAAHFGKRHDNVIRAIRNLECSDKFARLNFEECFEINKLANGKPEPYYSMTKDGFMFLVMGFTGAKAAEMKERFIDAFNWMGEQLQRQGMSLWQQRQALIIKDANSKARASFGSHLMLDRKRDLPDIREEYQRIDKMMQPTLPFLLN